MSLLQACNKLVISSFCFKTELVMSIFQACNENVSSSLRAQNVLAIFVREGSEHTPVCDDQQPGSEWIAQMLSSVCSVSRVTNSMKECYVKLVMKTYSIIHLNERQVTELFKCDLNQSHHNQLIMTKRKNIFCAT